MLSSRAGRGTLGIHDWTNNESGPRLRADTTFGEAGLPSGLHRNRAWNDTTRGWPCTVAGCAGLVVRIDPPPVLFTEVAGQNGGQAQLSPRVVSPLLRLNRRPGHDVGCLPTSRCPGPAVPGGPSCRALLSPWAITRQASAENTRACDGDDESCCLRSCSAAPGCFGRAHLRCAAKNSPGRRWSRCAGRCHTNRPAVGALPAHRWPVAVP